jgi:hypothetical protein
MGFFSRIFNWNDRADGTVAPTDPASSELGLDAAAASAILAELDIDTAIANHENWKVRLQNQIHGASLEQLDPEAIRQDNRCDLGRWLHGPGRERLGHYPAFTVLVARHQYFHVQASAVAAQAQGGDMAGAEKTLNGSFRHASNQVVLLLKALRQGLGQR